MPEQHEHRRRALATVLQQRDLDAALMTDLVNVRYLSGFTGSNGAVLLRCDASAMLATDGRYRDQSAAQSPDLEQVIDRDLVGVLLRGLPAGPTRVAVETHVLSVDAHAALTAAAPAGVEVVSLERAVEALRVVKDQTEVDTLAAACEISVRALERVHAGPLVGRTERAIARDLEWAMYDLGAEAVGFDTIVAGGPHSAIPHHEPTDRTVEDGDLLKIDFGARVDGYHADCTRTVVVGHADAWQREVYAAVRAAQQAGVDALQPGRFVGDADDAARRVLDDAGWLAYFTTGLGHGVGLQIHEDPFISTQRTATLEPRTALTMEPGIYVPGRGGVRIEDTLVVTAGAPNVLTAATKDLLELA